MAMGVEVYTSVAPIAREWDELADRASVSPFLRPGWIGAWFDAFGRGKLEVAALRRERLLVAVVPLARWAGGVHSTSNWHSPEWGSVAEDPEAARELFDGVFAWRPAYAMLRFFGPGGEEAAAAARAAGYAASTRVVLRSPFIPLAGGWEALRQPRAKAIAKSRRKLENDHGEVTVEVADGRTALDDLLEEGLRVEGSGWKVEQGTAIVSRQDTRRFYTDVARWAAERGMLRLLFVRAGGRTVAFELCFEDANRFYPLKGGYDPEFRKLSPGMMSAHEMVRFAAERGLETFEYLGADDPEKLEWTDELRERTALEAFSSRPLGVLARASYLRGRPLAKRVLATVKRAGGRGERHAT